MKTLLGCLMCLVLTLSQAFAISGGPFSGRQRPVVTGSYAGAFVALINPVVGVADNSLAVFTLRIAAGGLATGTTAIFRNGFYYPGTLSASADPGLAQVSGVIQGQFDDIVQSGTTIVTRHYYAAGQFLGARIVAQAGGLGLSAIRLRGTASISYVPGAGFTPDPRGDSGGAIQYKIRGFKQSFETGG